MKCYMLLMCWIESIICGINYVKLKELRILAPCLFSLVMTVHARVCALHDMGGAQYWIGGCGLLSLFKVRVHGMV